MKKIIILLALLMTVSLFGCDKGKKIEKITFFETDINMYVGDQTTMGPVITPTDFTEEYSWKSSDESVATVDSLGKVVGRHEGVAIITITSQYGKSASCTIHVQEKTAYSQLSYDYKRFVDMFVACFLPNIPMPTTAKMKQLVGMESYGGSYIWQMEIYDSTKSGDFKSDYYTFSTADGTVDRVDVERYVDLAEAIAYYAAQGEKTLTADSKTIELINKAIREKQ